MTRPGATAADPPDDAVTGEHLLGRVARGDERAFERVYDQFAGAVLGVAKRVVRDPAQAEEVTQEVFVQVWQRAAGFDAAKGSARAWIMTIAHARAVDRVRSVQASTLRDQAVGERMVDRDTDTVIEAVEASLERQAVRRCLQTLTDLQRESVTLAYYSGYTYPQVATVLGAPLPTVKTRMRDGLIRLRDCLGVTA